MSLCGLFSSMDVTFAEKQSFFQNLYLQGEPSSSMEDRDLFLLDFPAGSFTPKFEAATIIPAAVPEIPATVH